MGAGRCAPGANGATAPTVQALLGQCDEAGDFVVEDVCYHDLAQQAPIPAIAPADESYVVLVSGFNLHPTNQAAMLPLQLFSDYIAGQLGGAEEQELVSRIARVVVGGNLVAGEEADMSADGMGASGTNWGAWGRAVAVCRRRRRSLPSPSPLPVPVPVHVLHRGGVEPAHRARRAHTRLVPGARTPLPLLTAPCLCVLRVACCVLRVACAPGTTLACRRALGGGGGAAERA